MDHIHKVENSAREKSNAKAEKSSSRTKERAGRSKKVAVKIPSGRLAGTIHSSPDSSPSSEEENTEATPAPLIHKRKRSSPVKRSSTTSGANSEKIASTKTAPSIPENTGQSRPDQNRPAPKLAPSLPTPSTTTKSAPTSSLIPLSSGQIPSPDLDDHLTLKKKKKFIPKIPNLKLLYRPPH